MSEWVWCILGGVSADVSLACFVWGVNVRDGLMQWFEGAGMRTSTAVRHNRFVFAHDAVVRVSSK